jgi:DNA-binding SARP family transcriptional activator/predicted ATPase
MSHHRRPAAVRLFGRFSLSTPAGELPLPTDKARLLLAYLIFQSPLRVPRRRIAGWLWPDLPERRALANLSHAVGQIRNAVEAVADDPLTADHQSIGLAADSVHADLLNVQQLRAAVTQHPHRDPQACLTCLHRRLSAIELTALPLLDGLDAAEAGPLEEWLHQQREQQRRLRLQDLASAAAMTRRLGADALPLYEQILELEPAHEAAHRVIMQILVERGDRSSALRRFQQLQRLLAAEFNAEPEAATLELVERIRDGKTAAPSAAPRLITAPPPLFGREQQIEQISDLLDRIDHRWITITGPGGVGKTSLALLLASRVEPIFRDGARLVRLDLARSTDELLHRTARALDFSPDPAEPLSAQLRRVLFDFNGLIVLDGADQLNNTVAALFADTVTANPRIVILATSRRPIRLAGESVIPLHGLPVVDTEENPALQLFRARAALAGPNAPTIPLETAAAICRLVGGLPLAIELAAAQARRYGAAELVTALATDPLAPLSSGLRAAGRGLLDRIFREVWRSLSPSEQQLLAALTSFAGDFTPSAAAAVSALSAAPQLLEQIISSGLVAQQSAERCSLHPLLHSYAARSAPRNSRHTARMRHADYFCARLADARLNTAGAAAYQRACTLREDCEDIFAAWRYLLDHRRVDQLLPLVTPLSQLGWFLNHTETVRELLLLTLDAATPARHPHLADAVRLQLARLGLELGDYQLVSTMVTAASHAAQPDTDAELLLHQALLVTTPGTTAAAEALLQQARALQPSPAVAARLDLAQSHLELFAGRPQAALDCLFNAQLIFADQQDERGLLDSYCGLAQTYLQLQQPEHAAAAANRELVLARGLHNRSTLLRALHDLLRVAAPAAVTLATVRDLFAEAEQLARCFVRPLPLWVTYHVAGAAAFRFQAWSEQHDMLRRALAIAPSCGPQACVASIRDAVRLLTARDPLRADLLERQLAAVPPPDDPASAAALAALCRLAVDWIS